MFLARIVFTYKESHQKIFEAIQSLFQNSEPIDILTVNQELIKRGQLDFVGGPQFIAHLTNRVASAANVEFHGRIISQKHILRELIRISTETIRDAYEDTTDVFELLDRTEQNLFGVAEGNIRKSFDKIENLIHSAVQNIEDAASKGSGAVVLWQSSLWRCRRFSWLTGLLQVKRNFRPISSNVGNSRNLNGSNCILKLVA